jgi:hypothetical protein
MASKEAREASQHTSATTAADWVIPAPSLTGHGGDGALQTDRGADRIIGRQSGRRAGAATIIL